MAWRPPYSVMNTNIPMNFNRSKQEENYFDYNTDDRYTLNSDFNQHNVLDNVESRLPEINNRNVCPSSQISFDDHKNYEHNFNECDSQFAPQQNSSHSQTKFSGRITNNQRPPLLPPFPPLFSQPPPTSFLRTSSHPPSYADQFSVVQNQFSIPPPNVSRQKGSEQNDNAFHNQNIHIQNRFHINQDLSKNSDVIQTRPFCPPLPQFKSEDDFAHRNLMNLIAQPPVTNSSMPLPIIKSHTLTQSGSINLKMDPPLPNLMHMPPPSIPSALPLRIPPHSMTNNKNFITVHGDCSQPKSESEDSNLTKFLNNLSIIKREKVNKSISIPKFRSALAKFVSLSNLLEQSKENLKSLVKCDDNVWNEEISKAFTLKRELSQICSFISEPSLLKSVLKKIQIIKRKREQKKKTKLNKLLEKEKKELDRKELNQEIDKWLDDISEKNLKLKKEAEMKKEADFILLEVRKKIHEAKRTIEKLKVFEKLRNVRQENATKKGLQIWSQHNENFEKKVAILKDVMRRQLSDYVAEEKALKVMLETEQEGQLEEEAQWKVKRAKTHHHNRQRHILECLFGSSDDPRPSDPIYLFHKFQSSAHNSIENLLTIRYQWDVHLSQEGHSIPQQWVVPVAPSDPAWEKCLTSTTGFLKH